MGVFTYETEIALVIPRAKLFKAFLLDDLIPKLAPQSFKSTEISEGDGGPGTIKKITFGEGSQLKYVKYRIDKVDHENFSYGYSAIEGDSLSDILEKISYDITLVASPDGGCILKTVGKYHTKGDHEINEEQIKTGKEKASALFYVVESYLLANPDVYNI